MRKQKAAKERLRVVQLYDNTWARAHDGWLHECCDCALVHTVRYKLDDGVLHEMWTVNKKQTLEARKRKPKRAPPHR